MPDARSSATDSSPTSAAAFDDRPASHRGESAASRLRWIILASLGPIAAGACGGRSFATDLEDDGMGLSNGGAAGGIAMGGAGGFSSPPAYGGGGNAGMGGIGGTATGGYGGDGGYAGSVSYAGSAMVGSGGTGMMAALVPGACFSSTYLGGGFERCETGQVHRPSIDVCGTALPRAFAFSPEEIEGFRATAIALGLPSEGLLSCYDDSDCAAADFGYCARVPYGGATKAECRYGCTSDDDCGAGSICFCGDPVGTCTVALCDSDAECTGELRCTAYEALAGACGTFDDSVPQAFRCQSYADQCTSNSDCGGATPYCASLGDYRACVGDGSGCVPGRPFLVAAAPRLAGWITRDDFWERGTLADAPVHPLVAAEPELRARLAQAWVEIGLMEHASIAAFARFALQLLALGAPPELLSATARAIDDETRHARACFALARRYSGNDVGPGPLDMSDALGACDLRESVLTTIEEGCIGETLAALEAAEAAEHCIDPVTRVLLEGIARDEAEHAALAWRFVAWALPRCSAEIVAQAHAKFDDAFSRQLRDDAAPASRSERELLHFGVVGPRIRADLRRRALRETLLPCAEALFGSLPGEPVSSAPRRERLETRVAYS